MTRAVPSRFGLVPAHETAQMWTNSRHLCHATLFVAINRQFFSAQHQDLSFLSPNCAERFPLWGPEAILDEVVGIIFVFAQIIPGAATNFLPIWGKQIPPWIFDSGDPISGHDRGNCSKGEAVSTKARGDKLVLLIGANKR